MVASTSLYLDVVAEEEREPDEWGEPGRLVRRRWISALDRYGQDHVDRLGRFDGYGIEPIGPITWLEEGEGDTH